MGVLRKPEVKRLLWELSDSPARLSLRGIPYRVDLHHRGFSSSYDPANRQISLCLSGCGKIRLHSCVRTGKRLLFCSLPEIVTVTSADNPSFLGAVLDTTVAIPC